MSTRNQLAVSIRCPRFFIAHFNSHTLANALIKLLPDDVKLQQLINETLHSQLPKNFCKKAHRYTVALIPVAKGTPMKEVVQTLLKQAEMMHESPERSAAK